MTALPSLRTKKIVLMALFIAVGIVLQTAEQILPLFQTVPGGKLGLGNIASIAGILIFGCGGGIAIAILRAVIGSFLFGGFSALPYSLCGALLSSGVMGILIYSKQKVFSLIGIGIIGASMHNTAQILVSSLLLRSGYLWTYLPVLLLLSIFSGGAVGICATKLQKYLSIHNLHILRKP